MGIELNGAAEAMVKVACDTCAHEIKPSDAVHCQGCIDDAGDPDESPHEIRVEIFGILLEKFDRIRLLGQTSPEIIAALESFIEDVEVEFDAPTVVDINTKALADAAGIPAVAESQPNGPRTNLAKPWEVPDAKGSI